MSRIKSLDGLRGVAAAVVLVHHTLLVFPALADAHAFGKRAHGPLAEVVTYSPLHLVWAGSEAVLLFFVLSGYVLTRTARGWDIHAWLAYYPRRLLRLYPPVWAVVAVTVALSLTFGRGGGESWWMTDLHHAPDWRSIAHDVTLVHGAGMLNTVLWSLQWEVLYSLLLPVAVLGARVASRAWVQAAGLVLCAALILVDAPRPDVRLYVAAFGVGTLLAARELPRPPQWLWAVTLTLITCRWWIGGSAWMSVVVVAMSALAVTLADGAAALRTPVAQWLGSRSFSLYLIHEPIIVAFGQPGPPAWGVLGALVALPAAEVFHRVVEVPSIAVGRAAAHRVRTATRPRSAPTSTSA